MIIILSHTEIKWAIEAAHASLVRWQNKSGHYNNRFNSHFKGRLGELAAEKFARDENLAFLPHFRFSEREDLCDIELTTPFPARIEVKTWSMEHWQELGRCISVDQYPALEKKADRVLWCLVEKIEDQTPEALRSLPHLCIELAGWSTLEDIQKAPIRRTGTGAMRKVLNYQLSLDKLRKMEAFLLQDFA